MDKSLLPRSLYISLHPYEWTYFFLFLYQSCCFIGESIILNTIYEGVKEYLEAWKIIWTGVICILRSNFELLITGNCSFIILITLHPAKSIYMIRTSANLISSSMIHFMDIEYSSFDYHWIIIHVHPECKHRLSLPDWLPSFQYLSQLFSVPSALLQLLERDTNFILISGGI